MLTLQMRWLDHHRNIYICLVGDQVDAIFLVPDQPRAVGIDTVMYVLEIFKQRVCYVWLKVHVVSCHLYSPNR
jgi:hypothetical protein